MLTGAKFTCLRLCECSVPPDRSTCVACMRHSTLTANHDLTIRRLRSARLAVQPFSQPTPTPRSPPGPSSPLVPSTRTLRPLDWLCLGLDVADADESAPVELAPSGFSLGSYSQERLNCGDIEYLLNGGICRTCDNYVRRYGVPRPDYLDPPPCGVCIVCGEEKRLASRRCPCHDCNRDELSRVDRDSPRRCAGCGRREKQFGTPGWSKMNDGRGGWVSLALYRSTCLTDSVVTPAGSVSTLASPSSHSPTLTTSRSAPSAAAAKASLPIAASRPRSTSVCATLVGDTKRAKECPGRTTCSRAWSLPAPTVGRSSNSMNGTAVTGKDNRRGSCQGRPRSARRAGTMRRRASTGRFASSISAVQAETWCC